jgi:hypothetical protein
MIFSFFSPDFLHFFYKLKQIALFSNGCRFFIRLLLILKGKGTKKLYFIRKKAGYW